MKLLYLECSMGAAGDMLTAALLELLDEAEKSSFLQKMNSLIPDTKVICTPAIRCGISGSHMDVLIHGQEEQAGDAPKQGEHEHMHSHGEELEDNYFHDEADHMHSHGEEPEHMHFHDEVDHMHFHEEEPEHTHFHDMSEEYHHHHAHAHHSMTDIRNIVNGFDLPETVKEQVMNVYQAIAEAESAAHQKPVEEIHFHEVGAMDAVLDITGVCYLMYLLKPDHVIASPVNLGGGHVHCAHGILPVPAPATAFLMKGIPAYMSDPAQGELCTPTGAALIRTFVGKFGPMPPMSVEKIGYGMGKKEFERANCVRAFWGTPVVSEYKTSEASDPAFSVSSDSAFSVSSDSAISVSSERTADLTDAASSENPSDLIYTRPSDHTSNLTGAGLITELSANLDDMTPEQMGYALQLLRDKGALDVFCTSIYMKKNRPAYMITCLCLPEAADHMAQEMLRCTTTFGVRRHDCKRYTMMISMAEQQSPWGPVHVKTGEGFGIRKSKPEYEDMAEIMSRTGLSWNEILEKLSK